RAQGDIHVYGNPHIWTSPLNAVQIARNILTGLKRVSPENADYFAPREKDFEDRMFRALYGDELVKLLGGPTLADLDRQGKLLDFLKAKQYQGVALITRLGGWLQKGMPFRGKAVACYHKEWDYFSREFSLPCVDYIEPKPGIPPTPGHVLEVINEMREQHIQVLLSTNYYDHNQVIEVAQKTGAKAVIVPSNTGGATGINTYFDLMNLWISELGRAFAAVGALLFALTRTSPREGRRVPQEAFIGIVYVVASAAAVLVANKVPGGGEAIEKTLTGSILWVTFQPTIIKLAAVYVALGLFHY